MPDLGSLEKDGERLCSGFHHAVLERDDKNHEIVPLVKSLSYT